LLISQVIDDDYYDLLNILPGEWFYAEALVHVMINTREYNKIYTRINEKYKKYTKQLKNTKKYKNIGL
jgi:hypothetical protein